MNYLLNFGYEIEKVFLPSLSDLKCDFYRSPFPKSLDIIIDSLMFMQKIYIGEECDKEYISYEKYEPNNTRHSFKGLNSTKLNKTLDFDVFTGELENLVKEKSDNFIEDITIKLSDENNFDFKLKKKLASLYKSIDSFEDLRCDDNKIMELIRSSFLSSYKKTLGILEHKYKSFYEKSFIKDSYPITDMIVEDNNTPISPLSFSSLFANSKEYKESGVNDYGSRLKINNPFNKEELKSFFYSDELDFFYKIEVELIKLGYIKDKKWDSDRKKLIELIFILRDRNFFIPSAVKNNKTGDYKKLHPVFIFFEKRYQIKLGDQRKPSKSKIIFDSLDKSLFPFFLFPKSK
jgi:hypothetical protein